MIRRVVLLGGLALVVAGCGDGETAPDELPSTCPPPSRVVGDLCLEPGVADDGCPAGTMFVETDSSCRPAGMVAEDCGEGFVHDGDVGCEPTLPTESCPPGLMAVPGETACRPVMGCGSGKWGDIPVDASTQYVDASFAGVSDGSAGAPWISITEGVAAVAPGALIAVAAGSYLEDVVVSGKSVRLHGVCPEQVELVGTGQTVATCPPAALCILSGADGTEVRGLAMRGGGLGLFLTGSEQVVAEQLWVHDNTLAGIAVENALGPTTIIVRASLIEANHMLGVFALGAGLSIDASVVRDTLPDAQGVQGRGIGIQSNTQTGAPPFASVRASLIERNHDIGVLVSGSEASIETTVVRDTLPDTQGLSGRGIDIASDPNGVPSLVTVRAVVLERNIQYGLSAAGSEVNIEATVVRDTLPVAPGQGLAGSGIAIQGQYVTGAPSFATVSAVLVERNHDLGVFVAGSEASIEATVVRDTLLNAEGLSGHGIQVQPSIPINTPSTVTVRASVLERNREFGLLVVNSSAAVDATAILATTANGLGLYGDGLTSLHYLPEQTPASLVVQATRIGSSERAGLSSFGSFASLVDSAIACAAFDLDGEANNGASFVVDDGGGNGCGCPAADGICKLVSAALEPPQTLASTE